MSVRILTGDVREQLAPLPDNSVHCCVTSPPYWGLRDYGVPGQLGSEKTPEEYVTTMVAVFREVRRVLRSDGTCWVNMGDNFASGKGTCFNPGGGDSSLGQVRKAAGAHPLDRGSITSLRASGLKPKDLIGMPWRLAFALQADGWWLRQDIIWHKPNPMPESCTDRCTKAHEYVFLLTKSAHYFYDAEAVKEPVTGGTHAGRANGHSMDAVKGRDPADHRDTWGPHDPLANTSRNKRSVWTIPSQAYSEAHFATFPEALVEPCILAGTSAKGCCLKCGAPWERVVKKSGGSIRHGSWTCHDDKDRERGRVQNQTAAMAQMTDGTYRVETIGWQPTCECHEFGGYPPRRVDDIPPLTPVPCTVLDPFLGSGTTAVVAARHGRNCIGIELNPAYVKLAEQRLHDSVGLLLA